MLLFITWSIFLLTLSNHGIIIIEWFLVYQKRKKERERERGGGNHQKKYTVGSDGVM